MIPYAEAVSLEDQLASVLGTGLQVSFENFRVQRSYGGLYDVHYGPGRSIDTVFSAARAAEMFLRAVREGLIGATTAKV
jgi:hypothetical protein